MRPLFKPTVLTVILFTLFFTETVCLAQFGGEFFGLSNSKKKGAQGPTELTADTLDFDIKNDFIYFEGNVVFNNDDVKITCDKMVIQLQKNKKSKGGKTVSKIICLRNVEIIRQLDEKAKDFKGKQKALAGKAVYDAKTSMITMTINPVLMRGKDKLKGMKQIIFRDVDFFQKRD